MSDDQLVEQINRFRAAYDDYVRAVDAISPEHGLMRRLLSQAVERIQALEQRDERLSLVREAVMDTALTDLACRTAIELLTRVD